MSKKYSKRRPTRSRYPSRKKSNSGGLWLLVVVIILIFATALFFLKKQKHADIIKPQHHEVAKKETINKTAKTTAKTKTPTNIAPAVTPAKEALPQPQKETAPQPQFDFYTLLPKSQLPEPGTDNSLSPKTKAPAATQYLLRVAALKNPTDADRLKAQLILLGFDANLQKTPINGTQWIRVQVGPYSSLPDAQADQVRLRKNNFTSVLLKAPTKPN